MQVWGKFWMEKYGTIMFRKIKKCVLLSLTKASLSRVW